MARAPEHDSEDPLSALRETAVVLGTARGEEREAIRRRRAALREAVGTVPPGGADRATHLRLVSERLARLAGETAGVAAAAEEALAHRGDLVWLALALPERARETTAAIMRSECAAEADAPGDAVAAARAGLGAAVRDGLAKRLAALEADAAPRPSALLAAAAEVADAGEDAGPEERRRLRALFARGVPALPPAEAADVLAHLAAEEEDRALDLLAAQADRPALRAAAALDGGRRGPEWARGLVAETVAGVSRHDPARKRLRRARRRFGKVSARLRRESDEHFLAARLERLLGPRFVAGLERLVFALIFAVLGILFLEALLPPGVPEDATPAAAESARSWRPVHLLLAYVDAAVCAVFLFEFCLKLSLARRRLRWFLRHFVIDLVPSVPYGLLTWHALDLLRAVRLARFARLTRVLRYVRAARPFVRLLRFFGLLQRALDRFVRRQAHLLNRNFVLFESPPEDGGPEADAGPGALRRTLAAARRTWRRLAATLPAETRAALVAGHFAGLPPGERVAALPLGAAPTAAAEEDQRAEDLLRALADLEPAGVEAALGPGGAERLAETLSRLDVPVLRLLPGLRAVIPAAREGEPAWRVARAGRALGRWLERVLERVLWVSDLSGVISGPQFLDGLGSAMARAAGRPARRLLIFGFFFFLLQGFVHLLGWDGLKGLTDWLGRTLGAPFLILGGFCLVVWLIGAWLRRIAGEATDFYTRTAEAQYISLLKSAKRANEREDLDTLTERVLRPEALLAGRPETEAREDLARLLAPGSTGGRLGLADRVASLYLDYLDGAMFHASDTRTTGQLLGNIALEHIRNERLPASREERRRLSALDLARERSTLRGPHLWFRSITHTVAQRTARLILLYNRRAVPLAERARAGPGEVAECEAFLDRRLSGAGREDEDETEGFRTTAFNALHFLAAEPARDRAVAEAFGEKTLAALRADRTAMIRTVFGTYPFHRLPRADRTLNPLEFYARHLSGGRAALLPLFALRALCRGAGWLLRRLRANLREVLRRDAGPADERTNHAPWDVAVRKIHRMRKPLYMECARFRAAFDPEYLGLFLFPGRPSGLEGRTYREDLAAIGAGSAEHDAFEALRADRATALAEFAAEAEAAGGIGPFLAGLGAAGPADGEAWRAAAIAYAIDYRGARTLSTLEARARETLADVLARRGRLPGCGPLRRALGALRPTRGLRVAVADFLGRFSPAPAGRRETTAVLRAVRADYRGLARLLALAGGLAPGVRPREAARDTLRHAALHPEPWTEQLVTLRTVQTLAAVDVRNYLRQVRLLGGFDAGEDGTRVG